MVPEKFSNPGAFQVPSGSVAETVENEKDWSRNSGRDWRRGRDARFKVVLSLVISSVGEVESLTAFEHLAGAPTDPNAAES
jgi:hypothetical protein